MGEMMMPVGPFGMFEEDISSCLNCISAVTGRVGDVNFNVVILKRCSCNGIVDPFSGTFTHADSEGEDEHFCQWEWSDLRGEETEQIVWIEI